MKRYSLFGLVVVIIGSFIGAGFASGKEIANYFAQHKLVGLFFIVVASVVFYYFIYQSLLLGNKFKQEVYSVCFGKAHLFIKVIVAIACLIIVGAMIAGNASLMGRTFSMPWVFFINLLMLVLVLIIVRPGYGLIARANTVMLPFIIVIIVTVCVLFLQKNFDIAAFASDNTVAVIPTALLNCVEYMAFNLMVCCVFFLEIGQHYTVKQIKKASIIASVVLGFLMVLIAATLVCGKEIIDCDLPFIMMAYQIGDVLGGLVSVVIFFALVTSLISSAYTISKYTSGIIKNRLLSIAVVLAAGFLISLFGFSFIVVNFYAFIGWFGAVFCVTLVYKAKTSK